ncbi:glycosyl transferase [Spirochaetia bacterium]|nr:glycosyl transferase [Spirochaetia bacterium]
MIPKIIHYCWFGGNPLPELAQKCITSWRKHCPGYELKLWNETNFDINMVPFTAQVASVKKWGFIVDYIRAWVVFNYGGIYLDTDVELLKPLDVFLNNVCFSGFENEKNIAPGLVFAGEKESVIAKKIMDFYASYNFIQEDGTLNLTPSPQIFTDILLKYGLKQNNTYQELGVFTAYPTEYFCPKSFGTGILTITENTHSVHHYDGSWMKKPTQFYMKMRYASIKLFGITLGKFFVIPVFIVTSLVTDGTEGIKKLFVEKFNNKKER